MKKYINLKYLVQYHPYHIDTFSRFANVTTELLESVLSGEEELTTAELFRIGEYTGVPFTVLNCERVITLNQEHFKHRIMMRELEEELNMIREWQKRGSHEADLHMSYCDRLYADMKQAFSEGGIPYCQYLGIKHRIKDVILFIENEQRRIHDKPRGIMDKRATA